MPRFALKDGSGIEINYEVIPGILPENTFFIHGNLASNRWWYPAESVWSRLAEGRNLSGSMILAEFRGCGNSSAPSKPEQVDMHLFAEDFIELIQSLKLNSVNLVGHSTGGLIATLMLAKAPALFRKAVLLDPVGPTGAQLGPGMFEAFENMKTNKEFVSVVMNATIYNNDPSADFFQKVVVEDAHKAVCTVGIGVLKALDGLDVRAECSTIMNDVLVLHGEHDNLLPVADSKALAALMKNGKFQIVPGHGHCLNVENPEQFVELISSFAFSQ